jgi:Big-like domain-containing protein
MSAPRSQRRLIAGLTAIIALLPATLFAPVARGALIDLLPPVGVADTLTMVHDRVAVVPPPGVLGNDLDLDGGATAVLDSSPTHGTVSLRSDGGYTYTPNAGYVGTDEFWYHATSRLLNSLSTPVTITITNVPPVAVSDAYSGTTGTPVVVTAPGVLTNDHDADGDAISAALVTGVVNGTLSFSTDGAFTYTPAAGFAGADGFTYRISDGIAWSSPAAVSLTVSPPPTPTPTPPLPLPTPTLPPLPLPTPTLPLPTPTLPPLPLPTPTLPPPTPTPRPTPTPTARPTPTPTPAPTPSPVPTPSPTPTASPSPAPAGPVSPGGPDGGTPTPGGDSFALPPVQFDPFDDLLGGFDAFGGFEWAVPAIVLGVPGLLLIVALLAQAAIGVVWLPMVRRHLAGVGLRRRREPVRG